MSQARDECGQPAGRPRDHSIDARVYAACRELLLESGWERLSMRQVAAQAGVSRTSVQLRWSSKAEMVLHAILGDTLELAPFTGTNRAAWIAWVVEGSHHIFDRPEVRAALPGLLLALQHDEALRTGIWRGFSDPAASLYDTDEAEADAARQDAQAILILAAGAALFSSVIAVEDDTPMLRARMVEILSRPPSGKGPG